MSDKQKQEAVELDPRIEKILQSLEGLGYGSVVITVHDYKITQIDRTEKYRYPMEKNR